MCYHYDMSNTLERVQKVVTSELGVKAEEATPEAWLGKDLGADSLDVIEVVIALEDEFGVTIPDEEMKTDMTVDEIVKLIDNKA